MKRPEPIELENNLGPDAVTGEINRVPWMAYDVDEMDLYIAEKDKEIAELKDKIKIYEDLGSCKKGCPALRHNQRRVESEIYKVELKDKEIKELKQKLEDVQASHYAEMVDAGMRERRLRRALWLARADRAIMTLEYFTIKCKWFQDYMKVEPPKCDVKMIQKWANVERKCRAKAELYK